MKKWICVIVAMLLLLAVGCTPAPEQPNTPESTNGTEGTTAPTITGSGVADSIFDDPQFGDKKPVEKETTVSQENTESADSAEKTDKPAEGDNIKLPEPGKMTYEEFIAMPAAQQRAYMESFGDDVEGLDAFFAWYNAEKSRYEKENPPIDIVDGGVVDLG